MAKMGKFRCSTCGRVFAMAMHLGRHVNAVHAAKSKRAAQVVDQRRSATAGMSTSDGRTRVLGVLSACRDELVAQRITIDSQVAALDQAIAVLGGPVVKTTTKPWIRRKPRPGRTVQAGTLPAYIRQVVYAHRGPMTIKEVTAAVLRAGFESRNMELPKTVGKFLAAMPNVVKVDRGVYRMK
jgi:hypothetical protein